MNNFIFYDTETSGVKELDFIQVIQFAAIQTNNNFIKLIHLMSSVVLFTMDFDFTKSTVS